jgi:pyruvate ferredoxin oxidoreductase alpha subunit
MAKKFELNEMEFWDGNYAASQALRQAQVDVVAAYPITPSTPIVENYGAYKQMVILMVSLLWLRVNMQR